MAIRAVIFDVGGVLVRDEDSRYRQAWAERLGTTPEVLGDLVFSSDVAVRATVGEFPYAAVWEHVAEALELDEETLACLERDYWRGDVLDEGLTAFLASLKGEYTTALLSNAWSNAREGFALRPGLVEAVDLVVISAEEGMAKPNPRIYTLTLERLGVAPEEAVFLDDNGDNIAAARELGIHAVLFVDREQAIADVRTVLEGGEPPDRQPVAVEEGEGDEQDI